MQLQCSISKISRSKHRCIHRKFTNFYAKCPLVEWGWYNWNFDQSHTALLNWTITYCSCKDLTKAQKCLWGWPKICKFLYKIRGDISLSKMSSILTENCDFFCIKHTCWALSVTPLEFWPTQNSIIKLHHNVIILKDLTKVHCSISKISLPRKNKYSKITKT